MKIKRMGLEYAEKAEKAIDKKELFCLLFSVIEKEVRFEDLRLILSPVLARLESVKAVIRMRNNEERLQNILRQLKTPQAMEFNELLVNKLTFCSPSPTDYAYIALNCYLERHMGTAEQFRQDWHDFRQSLSFDVDEAG